jgi:hypothetical protein
MPPARIGEAHKILFTLAAVVLARHKILSPPVRYPAPETGLIA